MYDDDPSSERGKKIITDPAYLGGKKIITDPAYLGGKKYGNKR